jgi:hypothetical protein
MYLLYQLRSPLTGDRETRRRLVIDIVALKLSQTSLLGSVWVSAGDKGDVWLKFNCTYRQGKS